MVSSSDISARKVGGFIPRNIHHEISVKGKLPGTGLEHGIGDQERYR